MLIGLSLSFCIKDILLGRVKDEEVYAIITGTDIQSEEVWEEVIKRYSDLYWTEHDYTINGNEYTVETISHEEEARKLIHRLRETGRIIQPRTMGQEPPNIAAGRWVDLSNDRVKGYR